MLVRIFFFKGNGLVFSHKLASLNSPANLQLLFYPFAFFSLLTATGFISISSRHSLCSFVTQAFPLLDQSLKALNNPPPPPPPVYSKI